MDQGSTEKQRKSHLSGQVVIVGGRSVTGGVGVLSKFLGNAALVRLVCHHPVARRA